MAERLNAAVLKTVEGYPPSLGSNPSLSASRAIKEVCTVTHITMGVLGDQLTYRR